jgi:hypothetical protein
VRLLPDDPAAGERDAGQLGGLEDRELGKHAIVEEDLEAVYGVAEAIDEGTDPLQPVEVAAKKALLGSRLDDGEEVEVGVLIQPVGLQPDRAQTEQGEPPAAVLQGAPDLFQTLEQQGLAVHRVGFPFGELCEARLLWAVWTHGCDRIHSSTASDWEPRLGLLLPARSR